MPVPLFDWRNAHKEKPEDVFATEEDVKGLYLVAVYVKGREINEKELRLVEYINGIWVETNHFLVVEKPDLWAKIDMPKGWENYEKISSKG